MTSKSEKCSPGVVPDGTDSEDDLRLLLECLHFQRGSPSSQRQAITTIATMCSTSASSRDLLRTSGGLSYMLNMLTSTTSHEIQQAALYTLGCATEKNVVNQMKLCDNHIFTTLCDILKCPDTPPFVQTAAAYLVGCLMSGNGRGQNLAREKRVINRLIVLFKSHLPPSDARHEGATSSDVRLWTSVCSALCAATNNPQNESNQCLCSQVFPAALSLLQSSCLTRGDVVRPAVTLITSCVASNGTTQERLRMVGGLRNLTNALRELIIPHSPTHSHSTELPTHLVKTISAAGFGHAINCDHLCSLGAVPLLLAVLERDGELDGHDKLNIVMCLGMLAENNSSAQRQVIENGGLHLLVRNMAESKEEELSKAATFVMQCCLNKNSPSGEPPSGHSLSADIARLDNMLRSKPSCEDTDSNSGLNPEALHILDTKKLPVNDRVSKWLETAKISPECSNEVSPDKPSGGDLDLLQKIQVLQSLGGTDNPLLKLMLGAGGLSQLSSLTGGDPMRFQLQNLKTAYLTARDNKGAGSEQGHGGLEAGGQEAGGQGHDRMDTTSKKVGRQKGNETRNERLDKTSKKTADVASATEVKCHPDPPAESLHVKRRNTTTRGSGKKSTQQKLSDCAWVSSEKPSSHNRAREAISRELEKERALREELEMELAREKSKRKELEKERSQTVVLVQGEPSKGSHRQDEERDAYKEQGDPLNQENPGVGSAGQTNKQTNTHQCMSQKQDKPNTSGDKPSSSLNTNKTPISVRANIRYATSSSVFRAPRFPTHQMVSKIPQTCGNPLKLASHVHMAKKQEKHQGVSYTSVIGDFGKTSSLGQSSAKQSPLECLGCKPRLKCPLITSRNFSKLLQADRFTCAYHRRIVNVLRHADTHPASLVRTSMTPRDTHVNTDATINYNTPTQTPNHYCPTTPVEHNHGYRTPELCCNKDDIYPEGTLQAGLHDTGQHPTLTQLPSQLTNTSRYYKYTEVSRPSHHNRDTVTQVHHSHQPHNQTQLHHQAQTAREISSQPATRGLTDITNSNPLSVYDYHTPVKVADKCLPKPSAEVAPQRSTTARRRPVRFTKQEEQYLVGGVRKLGRRWRHILTAYPFHPSRTAVDLKDKHRLLHNTKT